MARFLFVLLLAFSLVPQPAHAWGRLGHRLVAALAWDDLTPQARARIAMLLEGEADPTLPGIASWADELREHDPDLGKRTGRWHYVNIAEDGCHYDAATHCKGGDCVVEAIRAQTAILADASRSKAERLQALKFVVHFVGDVHQPLHAGFGRDKGGNDFQLQFDGRGTNLHSLWDSGMLKAADLEEAQWLQRLRAIPLAVDLPPQPLSPPSAQWAEASCRIVLRPGFYPSKATIGDAYVQTWRPLAEEQLRRGGAELAVTLNAALSR
ncbi:S1/P1 nuclease [Lysobacter auxotrophicus]|uniref:S1/P1 nuclease n=1 Tax=Lysobacter auxotrophicus TaxID=2992573 RepID=A0ABM8DH44_9GAMM|nr:S1/P1 nuclease [Lysobacter auxotrophicus]BDU17919.1 S1/P1 nuclease [Lysobacter auxotrophicus]